MTDAAAALPAAAAGRLAALVTYTACCAVLHSLLQQHYYATCKSSWLSLFALDPGPYCELVRKSLAVIQWSPLVASGFWLPRAQAQLLGGGGGDY